MHCSFYEPIWPKGSNAVKLNLLCPICGSNDVHAKAMTAHDIYDHWAVGERIICNHCGASIDCLSLDDADIDKLYAAWDARCERKMLDTGYLTCGCCGGSPKVEDGLYGYTITCTECGLGVYGDTRRKAKSKWNKKIKKYRRIT